jgi:CRP/FNR family cyclic AMP-dependent transcriptional regulator
VDRSRVTPLMALDGVPEEELDAVARVATEREFAQGETLMSEGDFGYSLFVIENGSAEVVSHGAKVAEVGPGDVVGEVAVLASGRRTASVIATSPVQALAFFKRDVWRLEDEAPASAERLRAAMDERSESSSEPASEE